MSVTPLMDPDGKPLTGQDGLLAPHAYNFAAVLQTYNRLYSYRWDEALRDAPQNALAMRRDAFYAGLLQERLAATINLPWEVAVENDDDPLQTFVKDGITRIIETMPDWPGFVTNLLEAVWYGRYGSQLEPCSLPAGGWGVRSHKPVNGDKIQYQWDGTPVVMVGHMTAGRIRQIDPNAIINTDRGGYGLRLYKPEWRERFVIHHHVADDADFFEGEMAGGVYGVGLRSRAYWSEFMRAEALSWMMRPMEAAGTMDLYLFNYYTGNAESKAAAERNAKALTGKLAYVVPRPANWTGEPVEVVPFNPAGIELLTRLVQEYYERHIERLFVGQSMSAGGGEGGGLEGDGRADFARDTKYEITKTDANRLAGTLTRDLIATLVRWNYPWAEFPVTFQFVIADPEAPAKLEQGIALKGSGVPIKDDELRELVGFTAPQEGDLVNGVPYVPGQSTDPNAVSADDTGEEDFGPGGGDPSEEDLYQSEPDRGQPGNPGQFGHLHNARKPKGPVGKVARKVGAAGRLAGRKAAAAKDEVLKKLTRTAGGRAVLAIGGPAVKAFRTIEHGMLIGLHKSNELAKEALHERGGSDKDVKRLGRILFVADMVGGYASGAAGYTVAGPVGAKVGSVMPTCSVAYLAYSTAKNPLATWRAAKTVVRRTLGTEAPAKYASVGLDDVGTLADYLSAAPDPDWSEALLLAALGHGQDLPSALTTAGAAGRQVPGHDAEQYAGPDCYDGVHAPAGGVSVGGVFFAGGEFIPQGVLDKATAGEREAIASKAVSADGSKPKKAAGGKPKPEQEIAEKIAAGVREHTGLSDELRAEYHAAATEAVGRMPAKAVKRLAAGLSRIRFYPTSEELTLSATGGDLSLSGGRVAGGAYDRGTKEVHLNGKYGKPNRQTYAHEFTHAIDGPDHELSRSNEWGDAWRAEIRPAPSDKITGSPPRLTNYATTSAAEGMAEFGRLIYGTDCDLEAAKQRFPLCAAAFKRWGLWPKK